MKWIESILIFLNSQMNDPTPFGWFHLLWLGITAGATILAVIYGPKLLKDQVNRIVLITALVVIALEIMKQVHYTFTMGENGIAADFQWFAFPFQFCSTPMYVGLIAGLIRKGKFYDCLCAYLATYAVFAGLAVMLYPNDVFTETTSINIQTMICHGSMIPIGALLYTSGVVKLEQKTVIKAACIFTVAVVMASVMNEIAHKSGLLDRETFNMFLISPYCAPSLPVYSLIQQVLPFPVSLMIYILGFTAAAEIMLLIATFCNRVWRSQRNSSKAVLTSPASFAIMR